MPDNKEKTYTKDEWLAEGTRLFGDDIKKWRFVCPHCGHIASGQDYFDAGCKPNDCYQNCIGRFKKGVGCDWAAYGLFDICKVHVDGIPVFDFDYSGDKKDGQKK